MSIDFMRHQVGVLRPARLHGRPGAGTGVLQLDVELDWHGFAGLGTRLWLTRVVGILEIVIGERRFELGAIEYVNDGPPMTLPEHAWQAMLPFRCELFPVQVKAIEEARVGGGGTVEVGVRLILEREGERFEHGHDIVAAYDVVRFARDAAQWSALLEELGFRRELLVGVPLLSEAAAPHWSGASAAFSRAEQALRNGLPRETVAACRDVFESLQRRWPRPDAPQKPTWSTDERYRGIVEAAKHLCHPAHHVGGTDESFSQAYDMDDARVVLSLAATLLAKAIHGPDPAR